MKKLMVTINPQEIKNAMTMRLNSSTGEICSVKEERPEIKREKRTIRAKMNRARCSSRGL